MDLDQARQELIAAGHYLFENGLTWGNAGNLSIRTAPDRFLVTASGTNLANLAENDFVEVGPEGIVHSLAGNGRPSKETPMHRAVYERRPEIRAVLHASPFYTTLIAASQEPIPADWFVENMYYLERVARVPYAHPGSSALGEAVREQACAANLLLLENHGVLAYDTSVREALMGLHTLELTCRMLVAAKSAGIPLRSVAPAAVADFLERSGYRPRRRWQP